MKKHLSKNAFKRRKAIKALRKYTDSRTTAEEFELISPAELLLVEAILTYEEFEGFVGKGVDKMHAEEIKRMKKIAEDLGVFPVSQAMEDAYDFKKMAGAPVGRICVIFQSYIRKIPKNIYSLRSLKDDQEVDADTVLECG